MSGLEERILTLVKELEEEKRLADKRAKQLYNLAGGAVPVGTIVPYLGGYFTDGNNGGFTMVMAAANTIAAVNALLNPDGFYVCDGATLNHASSPIWNAAGRYLPKLTDDRFIQGDTLAGGVGGNNAMAHTHVPGTLATNTAGAHTHNTQYASGQAGVSRWGVDKDMADRDTYVITAAMIADGVIANTGGVSTEHSHSVNAGVTGAASNTENRPKFLGCFYIVRAF